MSGREPRRADPDDWFADSDQPPFSSGSAATAGDEPLATDDLPGERTVKLGTLLGGAAVLAVLLLVAGLALAGVFSGGGKPPATTALTTGRTPTTSRTPTTTPTTTPRTTIPAPATTLKPGDQGAQVKHLQRALAALGYTIAKVDGDYGPATQAALQRFQKASGLTEDGVFGAQTRHALQLALRKLGT